MTSAIDSASVTKVLSATGPSVPQHHSPYITADASSESQLRPTPAKDRGEETDSDGPTDSSTYPDQSGKCHSLDVLNMQVLQTGDDFTLPPVILLKPGEKFPEASDHEVPRHTYPCLIFDPDQIATDCIPMKAVKRCKEMEKLSCMQVLQTGDDFTLPPVILLKPGEKFLESSDHEVPRRTYPCLIFDPDQIATDCVPMKAVKRCKEMEQLSCK